MEFPIGPCVRAYLFVLLIICLCYWSLCDVLIVCAKPLKMVFHHGNGLVTVSLVNDPLLVAPFLHCPRAWVISRGLMCTQYNIVCARQATVRQILKSNSTNSVSTSFMSLSQHTSPTLTLRLLIELLCVLVKSTFPTSENTVHTIDMALSSVKSSGIVCRVITCESERMDRVPAHLFKTH